MSEKIVGYLLLLAGVGAIIFAGLSVYSSFTTGSVPINIFHLKSISIDPLQMVSSALPQSLSANLKTATTSGSQSNLEILPADVFSQMANLLAYVILMTFVLNLGSKIAGLGIQLLRPGQIKNVGA